MKYENLFKMMHNLLFGPPQGTPIGDFGHFQQRMVDTLREIYLEGLAKGEVKEANPDEVAMLVLGMLDFCFHLDHKKPDSSDPMRPERLLRLSFQGLAKSSIM